VKDRVAARLLLALAAPLAAWAADGDVEEARIEAARSALPDLLGDLAPLELPCDAGAERAARLAGRVLWRDAASRVHRDLEGAGDDRPLYWQRLTTLRDARGNCPRAIAAFEAASRGFADVIFDAGSEVKVLVTGFDPFLLDRDVTQSNPSGVAALYLDDLRTEVDAGGSRRSVEIQSIVVPVRFQDFDDGLVEREIVPLALRNEVDLLVTISMGREAFDLERFPGRRRSASAPDNRNVLTGGSAERPVLPRLGEAPLAGPEFVESTLPIAAMLAVKGPFEVRDNRVVTTLEEGTFEAASLEALDGRTAVRGGGGGYLSNEISYRVLNALRAEPDAPRSGHVHTPRIRGHDPASIAAIVRQIEAMILAAAADHPPP
jgi:pyrrolidone-carboxylate peptidase